MVSDQDIKALADRIATEFHPQRIVLFGSRAAGRAREDSDIDLLVVLDFDGPAYLKAAEIRAGLSAELPIDIVARTPADKELWVNRNRH